MKVGDAEESRSLGGIATGVTQAQFRAWYSVQYRKSKTHSDSLFRKPGSPAPPAPIVLSTDVSRGPLGPKRLIATKELNPGPVAPLKEPILVTCLNTVSAGVLSLSCKRHGFFSAWGGSTRIYKRKRDLVSASGADY